MGWKGYDVEKGDLADGFKQYLRDRGLYFEPSEDGNLIHFEVRNPDKAVDDWINTQGSDIYEEYVFEFPEQLTPADVNVARKMGLKYLGQHKYKKGGKGIFIQGTLPMLKEYAYEYLGDYELHPDFLTPADEFAGVDELVESGYFNDAKDVRLCGSKFKDSDNDAKVIEMAQQELDNIQEELETIYFDEEGNEINLNKIDYNRTDLLDERATALCYLIKAYGGTPIIGPGWDGLANDYDGPVKSK